MPDLLLNCLVATYNAGSTLPSAIESLRGFDRVLVVDDGSTDETLDYLIQSPVEFISTPHQGMLKARNTAFNHLELPDPNRAAIATFDADDVRNQVTANQRYLMTYYNADILLCPIARNGRSLQLTGNPVLDVLGCNLHSSGLLVRASLLMQLRELRGSVWRVGAKCRSENWLLLDLLRFNPKVAYMNIVVCDWRPGNFTLAVSAGDRLAEFNRQANELKEIVGFRWTETHERTYRNMAIALKYNVDKEKN